MDFSYATNGSAAAENAARSLAPVRALDLTHGSIYGLAIRLLRPCGDRRSVRIGCKDSCYSDRMNSMYGRGSSLRRFCQISPW